MTGFKMSPGSLSKKILLWLAVHYKSVRRPSYYFFYRLREWSWIDFYSDYLDKKMRKSRDSSVLLEKMEGKRGGTDQFEYLKRHGLKPEHVILDYGCGYLRAGIHLIKYLVAGHYVGVDISAERLAMSHELAAKAGISDNDYHLFRVKDCNLRELQEFRFDYVWAQSVLTHMPLADIRIMLASLKPLLQEDGRFLFTYLDDEKPMKESIKNFYYSTEQMQATCNAAGYSFTLLDDWESAKRVSRVAELRHTC